MSASGSASALLPLTTARLTIDLITLSELPAVAAYRGLPEVAALQSWAAGVTADDLSGLVTEPTVDTLATAGSWIQLALRLRGDTTASAMLMGDMGVGADAVHPDTYELGVTVDPRAQGRGLAAEAWGAVTDWLMEKRHAHRLVAQMDARNLPMIALAERLGWRHEGAVVDGDWFKGEWTTLHRYALLRREWRHSH